MLGNIFHSSQWARGESFSFILFRLLAWIVVSALFAAKLFASSCKSDRSVKKMI